MKCYCVVDFRAPLQEMDQPTPCRKARRCCSRSVPPASATATSISGKAATTWVRGARCRSRNAALRCRLTMGHETVGAVVSAGPDATGLRPGGNYLVYPWIGCGNCPSCQAGQENHCMARPAWACTAPAATPTTCSCRTPAT